MSMFKKAMVSLTLLAFVMILVGLLLPSNIHIERSITVQSNAQHIYPYLNNFKRFNQWSPWAMMSKDTQYEFLGPSSGVGAIMKWNSDDPKIGQGSQEILEVEENRKLRLRLVLGENEDDMTSSMLVSFDLQPQGEQTKVSWGLDKEFGYNLLGRYFGLMIEQWVGPEYELGLKNLKNLVEKSKLSQLPSTP